MARRNEPRIRKRRGDGTSAFTGRLGVWRGYRGWRWRRLTRCF